MENYKKKAIELLMGLAINGKSDPAVIPYIPAKVAASGTESRTLKRNIAGKGRKYSRVLLSLVRDLECERRANVHNLMIIKDGEVILEASAPGYSTNIFHLAHSMSKSVTALAIGILSDEGKLKIDERIIDIFPEMPFCDPRFADITVEDLLTMRSGVPFAELGTVTTDKWTDTFFESELNAPPAESFHYNSMNSYILGKIVTRIAKKRLSEYLREKLFSPLGIENYLWEIGPEGTEKGGFGLYLSCESFAKIGMMILGGGVFEGKRIISSEFIERMTKTQVEVKDTKLDFDYGYHVWTGRDKPDVLLNGMLGQNVLICPDNGVVVSLNSGNNELFSDSPALDIIRRHVCNLNEDSRSTIKEFCELKRAVGGFFVGRHWIRPLTRVRTLRNLFGLFRYEPFDYNWTPLLGTYAFAENNSSTLPLFVSVMQNNYVGGIEKIKLEKSGERLILTTVEGGISYEIPIGLYTYAESTVNFKGERYIVRAYGEAMEDEDRNPVYKIELIFPELPNTRIIKITHSPEGIRLRMSENPNQRVADRFFSSLSEGGKVGFAMGLLEKKVGEDFLSNKLTEIFNVDLSGIDTSIEGWEEIMESVNSELCAKRDNNNKFIKNVVNRFIGEAKEEKIKEEKPKSGGFLAKALSAIVSKFTSSSNKGDDAPPPYILQEAQTDFEDSQNGR